MDIFCSRAHFLTAKTMGEVFEFIAMCLYARGKAYIQSKLDRCTIKGEIQSERYIVNILQPISLTLNYTRTLDRVHSPSSIHVRKSIKQNLSPRLPTQIK